MYYQSWIVSDNEKGTDIILTLSNIKGGVTFDSVVFRGLKLKAFVTEGKNEVSIKSIIPSGKSRIVIRVEPVNLPDQLIYHYKGERKIHLLKKIERKKTRFIK